MPIDPSIYSNIQTPQMPSVADNMSKALTLSNLGLQNQNAQMANQQMQYQMQGQQAMRDAFRNNTDANGNLNRQGALSDIAKVNPTMGMQLSQQWSALDKAQAEKQAAQADAASKTLNITGPAFDYMKNSVPPEQRAAVWSRMIQQLKDQGIDVSRMDHDYDPVKFDQYYQTWQNSKESLANQVSRADINQKNMDPMKVGAEELGKFNEDVNNASSRKTTGALIDTRTRADRVLSLVGRQPGEDDQTYLARLNKYMPQVGTEVGTSLAAIMQGGVPNETLQKELAPDTMNSKLASLQQKWKAQPTAANQGALLAAYGDIASKLRDFSAGQLNQITERSRAAYPYANKYFADRMDKIATQITPATSGGQGPGGMMAGKQNGAPSGGGGLIPSANAADGPARPKAQPVYRAPGSSVSADQVSQYAVKHGMKLSEAQKYLKGQGYVIGN